MGIKMGNNIIIKNKKGNVNIELTARITKEMDMESLLKKLSKKGRYPQKKWFGFDAQNPTEFNTIVDNIIDNNRDKVYQGVNKDTAPGAKFENIETKPFVIEGKEYTIFITRQESPRIKETHYREISILEVEGRVPEDPRLSRTVSLISTLSLGNIRFIQNEDTNRDLWWQMREIWRFLKINQGITKI